MKVIENYKRAIENSDENLLKEVFAPQVRVEIPAGATLNHPVNTACVFRRYALCIVMRTCGLGSSSPRQLSNYSHQIRKPSRLKYSA